MNKRTKNLLQAIVAALMVLAASYGLLPEEAGASPPRTLPHDHSIRGKGGDLGDIVVDDTITTTFIDSTTNLRFKRVGTIRQNFDTTKTTFLNGDLDLQAIELLMDGDQLIRAPTFVGNFGEILIHNSADLSMDIAQQDNLNLFIDSNDDGTNTLNIYEGGTDEDDASAVNIWSLAETGIVTSPGKPFAMKSANETVTSSAAFQDDDHLVVDVESGASYSFELTLIMDSVTAAGFRQRFTTTSSALTMSYACSLTDTAITLSEHRAVATAGSSMFFVTNDDAVIECHGIVSVSGTSGDLQFQWGQNVSDANGTDVFLGSWMRLERML